MFDRLKPNERPVDIGFTQPLHVTGKSILAKIVNFTQGSYNANTIKVTSYM